MLDSRIRSYIDPALDQVGKWLNRRGISANFLTGFGFGIGIAAAICLAFELYWFALVLILLSRLCDGLDGAIARCSSPTDFGGYLDITLDFIFYSGIVFAFAVGRPEAALAAAFLIFSFVGTGASFLAYAVMAEKRGIRAEAPPTEQRKSLFYLGGLTEGFETIFVLCLLCLLPDFFGPIAWTFGALCWITTSTRILVALQTLKSEPKLPEAPRY